MYSTLDFIKHIQDESAFILRNTLNENFESFMQKEVLQKAIIRSLEIIGEASKKIPQDFKLNHPLVDWKSMAGTRDKLIHHYFGVDYEIVWDIIENEIPFLDEYLVKLIQNF
ncbi:MAG: DUF86 domain-containing protein [Flavobacteriia bacterium]|jgi:uncharacterized protein with HEPN domain